MRRLANILPDQVSAPSSWWVVEPARFFLLVAGDMGSAAAVLSGLRLPAVERCGRGDGEVGRDIAGADAGAGCRGCAVGVGVRSRRTRESVLGGGGGWEDDEGCAAFS
jgi:hypothetical protein